MKICFWHSDKPRERLLADAFVDGVLAVGADDQVEKRALLPTIEVADCDLACMVGVKSRELFAAHAAAGVHVLYFDKGYTRHAANSPVKLWEYWRVALDAHQPTERLGLVTQPDDRREQLKIVMQPWRSKGGAIVIAGSSQKYHDFYGLKSPSGWAQKVINHLRRLTKREIIYRPKPSWREAVPLEGSTFSQGRDLLEDLQGAHALVTHGSNAVFEAMICGIPQLVLGPAVTAHISSHGLDLVETPRLATYGERYQWLSNLAYWQYTMSEMSKGELWRFIRPQLYG